MTFNPYDDDGFQCERAFHETGHLWAARHLGLPTRGASIWTGQVDRPPMRSTQAAEYALAGLLAQALSRDWWACRWKNYRIPCTHVRWTFRWSGRRRTTSRAGTYCSRGSDPEAVPVLRADEDDEDETHLEGITPMVNHLLADWQGIDRLVGLLFANEAVRPLELRRCLR